MDHFSLLPLELKEYIFKFLSGRDLWICMSVCSEWRQILNFNNRWKRFCRNDHVDIESVSDEEKENSQKCCKCALLWMKNAQNTNNWRVNSFIKRSVNCIYAKDLTCQRIHVHKRKVAFISCLSPGYGRKNYVTVHTINKKGITAEVIHLALRPHAITMNDNFIFISSGNVLIAYKKDVQYKIYLGLAFRADSRLYLATKEIMKFVKSKQQRTAYLRMEVLCNEYLWLSCICLDGNNHFLFIVNVETLQFSSINIVSRIISATKKRVIVSSPTDIHIFNFQGDLILKLDLLYDEGRFKATDDFIVTSPRQGMPVTVWNMDGKKLRVIHNVYFYDLDPIRHLLFECSSYSQKKFKLSAISLHTGTESWFVDIPKTDMIAVDDVYQVCNKFLVVDMYPDMCQPKMHCAFVIDLDNKCLLYRTDINGITMSVSEYLWVLKINNKIIFQIY